MKLRELLINCEKILNYSEKFQKFLFCESKKKEVAVKKMIANFLIFILALIMSVNAQETCREGAECVDFFLCENGTIITDGQNILDIRFEGDSCKVDDYTQVS